LVSGSPFALRTSSRTAGIRFHFKDDGWDPTLMSFEGWRANVRERFEASIEQHRLQMLTLIKQRG